MSSPEAILFMDVDATGMVRGSQQGESALNSLMATSRKMETSNSTLANSFKTLAPAIAAAFGGAKVAGMFRSAIQESAMFREDLAQFNHVFRNVRQEAEEMIQTLQSDMFGRSARDAMKMTMNMASLLKGMELTDKAAVELSGDFAQLSIDIGSFLTKDASDVMNAFQGALMGNMMSLRNYGVFLTTTSLKAKVFENAQKGMTFESERAAFAYALLQEAQRQQADAIGDFAVESQSYRNQVNQLTSDLTDLKQIVGEVFLGQATEVIKTIRGWAKWFKELDSSTQKGIVLFTTLGGVVVGIGGAWKATGAAIALYNAAIGAATAAAAQNTAAQEAESVAASQVTSSVNAQTAALEANTMARGRNSAAGLGGGMMPGGSAVMAPAGPAGNMARAASLHRPLPSETNANALVTPALRREQDQAFRQLTHATREQGRQVTGATNRLNQVNTQLTQGQENVARLTTRQAALTEQYNAARSRGLALEARANEFRDRATALSGRTAGMVQATGDKFLRDRYASVARQRAIAGEMRSRGNISGAEAVERAAQRRYDTAIDARNKLVASETARLQDRIKAEASQGRRWMDQSRQLNRQAQKEYRQAGQLWAQRTRADTDLTAATNQNARAMRERAKAERQLAQAQNPAQVRAAQRRLRLASDPMARAQNEFVRSAATAPNRAAEQRRFQRMLREERDAARAAGFNANRDMGGTSGRTLSAADARQSMIAGTRQSRWFGNTRADYMTGYDRGSAGGWGRFGGRAAGMGSVFMGGAGRLAGGMGRMAAGMGGVGRFAMGGVAGLAGMAQTAAAGVAIAGALSAAAGVVDRFARTIYNADGTLGGFVNDLFTGTNTFDLAGTNTTEYMLGGVNNALSNYTLGMYDGLVALHKWIGTMDWATDKIYKNFYGGAELDAQNKKLEDQRRSRNQARAEGEMLQGKDAEGKIAVGQILEGGAVAETRLREKELREANEDLEMARKMLYMDDNEKYDFLLDQFKIASGLIEKGNQEIAAKESQIQKQQAEWSQKQKARAAGQAGTDPNAITAWIKEENAMLAKIEEMEKQKHALIEKQTEENKRALEIEKEGWQLEQKRRQEAEREEKERRRLYEQESKERKQYLKQMEDSLWNFDLDNAKTDRQKKAMLTSRFDQMEASYQAMDAAAKTAYDAYSALTKRAEEAEQEGKKSEAAKIREEAEDAKATYDIHAEDRKDSLRSMNEAFRELAGMQDMKSPAMMVGVSRGAAAVEATSLEGQRAADRVWEQKQVKFQNNVTDLMKKMRKAMEDEYKLAKKMAEEKPVLMKAKAK